MEYAIVGFVVMKIIMCKSLNFKTRNENEL